MQSKAKLIYIFDPMCSWCWGYAPVWQQLKQALDGIVTIEYRVGGLAPDSEEPMPLDMQSMLQNTWHSISNKLGTQFNFDFWHHCQPRRSTYLACRAVLLARRAGKEGEMIQAIQHAYYLHARNPSDTSVLAELAKEIGISDVTHFIQQLDSCDVNTELFKEVTYTRSLPIQGFPSLVLNVQANILPISIDYSDWQVTYATIAEIISN
ncbi:DsbA family protein [Pseudoalteromonas sp. H105]|jgi:putative protein-disulfide isomerase|uniref:DsbA family protein n=1 Tax=Pseudoalteromonas sp. H105 TaxID=1348393 RepID=UPI0007322F0D|nr:DsbA family protein [Pseudoalteromonas sp. H105]KTF16861.1 thioredoxin [Pseudoalteromonas sp. H105]